MKFITTQLSYVFQQPESRRNLKLLGKLFVLLAVMITTWAVLFHVIMGLEGQEHTWFTGFYWALTVMTTLGFGDITFHTDLGRGFSTVVLISGVVFLLIVLPFAFIRFFYAPWLEARLRLTARRELPATTHGHVIVARYDEVAAGFIRRLTQLGIPYVVIEPDTQRAAMLHSEGVSAVAGEFDARETFARLRASSARMLVANLDDASNTNMTLTFREEAPGVSVTALAESWDAVDILELSGANHVMPLKHLLGQQLALRAAVGQSGAQVVGRFRDFFLAELAVQRTPLEGKLIRETQLRQELGLNVVGAWERGQFIPAAPGLRLTHDKVIVVMGTRAQLDALDVLVAVAPLVQGPTLVIGAGKVGRAAARALTERGVQVNMVEQDEAVAARAAPLVNRVVTGDAAHREVLMEAGLAEAPAVLLTTNSDAVNIYLSVYCRRLNPDLRIVSRITHERNLEAIHRAGADFVLSYSGLAVRSLIACVLRRELVILGEGVDLYYVALPPLLAGTTLASSAIGTETGLNVIAVQRGTGEVIPAGPGIHLTSDTDLLMIGTPDQRRLFTARFGEAQRDLRPGTTTYALPAITPTPVIADALRRETSASGS